MRVLLAIILIATNWCIDRGGPGRSGLSQEIFTPPLFVSNRLFRKLPMDDNERIVASPVIKDGVIVIGTTVGNLYALDIKTFSTLWQIRSEGTHRATALIDEDFCFIGEGDKVGKLSCLDMKDGSPVWPAFKLSGWVNSSPLPFDNLIIFGANDNRVHALDKQTGKEVDGWSSEKLNGQIQTGIALMNDRLYVGTYGQPESEGKHDEGNLYCLDTKGKKLWGPKQTKGSIKATPATSNGLIFITSAGYTWEKPTKGRVSCYDETGNLIWITDLPDEIWSSPATDGKHVIVGCRDTYIYCLDAEDNGNIIWKKQTESWVNGSPIISEGVCYIGSRDGFLYILDTQTGKTFGEIKLSDKPNGMEGSAAICDGYLVCITFDGKVYRFEQAPKAEVKVEPTEFVSTDGSYSFNLSFSNARQNKINTALEIGFKTSSDWLSLTKYDTKLESGESKQIEIGGKAQPGKYEASLHFYTNEEEKTIQDITLTLEVKKLFPIINLSEKTINFGEFWDDETSQPKYFTIRNDGDAFLTAMLKPPNGIKLTPEKIFIQPKQSQEIKVEIIKGIFSVGTIQETIEISGVEVQAKIEIIGIIKRSKLTVKVTIGSFDAFINNLKTKLDAAPYISKGTTMVPLRLISTGLGFEVEWVKDLNTVIINLGDNRFLRLVIGYKKAIIEESDSSIKQLDLATPPEIQKGRTFIPLRFIGEIMGAIVEWNSKERSATLTRSLKK